MKALICAICLSAVGLSHAAPSVYVKPYINKNGALVDGHFKTAPNGTTLDNYSTQGNINPYTGQPGTKTSQQPQLTPYLKNPYSPQRLPGQPNPSF